MKTSRKLKKLLRKRQVCERYGNVTPRTIERKVKDKTLPPPIYPFNNKIPFWDEDELDDHDRRAGFSREAA
jgi:hypothetical protein